MLERNLHNVANYLIASLAVADLLVAVLVMPLAAVNEVTSQWFLGSEICDMWTSFDVLCCTSSILHLVAISLDRYWVVTRVDYICNRSARRILLMIGLSWGVSAVISIPPLFGWKSPQGDLNNTGQCIISQDLGYTVFSTVGAFYIPLISMMIIYCKVYRAAKSRIRKKQFRRGPFGASCAASDAAGMAAKSKCHGVNEASAMIMVTSMTAVGYDTSLATKQTVTTDAEFDHTSTNGKTIDAKKSIRKFFILAARAASIRSSLQSSTGAGGNGEEGRAGEPSSPYHATTGSTRSDRLLQPCDSEDGSPTVEKRRPVLKLNMTLKTREQKAKEKLEQKRERKAARTLAIVTGTFVICWLPFFIVATVSPFCGDQCHYPVWLMSVIGWLGYFNSLLNPVIYTIFNPDFRSAFRKILFGKYAKNKFRQSAV